MRRIFAVAVIACLIASTAWAGPKDKVKEALIQGTSIHGTGNWNNDTVSAGYKSGKCKIKIAFKDTLAAIEGDEIVCLAGADVRATSLGGGTNTFGNTAILKGIVTDGQLKMKGDLSVVGCGNASDSIAINGTMTCYNEDLAYAPDLPTITAKCSAMPGGGGLLLVGNAFFDGDNLVGVCQGSQANGGQRIGAPANGVLVVQGISVPCDDLTVPDCVP